MLNVLLSYLLINTDTAHEIPGAPENVTPFVPVDIIEPYELLTEPRCGSAFEVAHNVSHGVLRRDIQHHVEVVTVKADLFQAHAWKAPEQYRQRLFEVRDNVGFQDLPAVFAHPDDMVAQIVDAMARPVVLHNRLYHRKASFIPG